MRRDHDGRETFSVSNPTGHARRTVGTWPTPDLWADRLIAALTEAAENETDPDKKSKLRKAAERRWGPWVVRCSAE